MTDTQSNIRINSSTLFAALRVLEEALPLVDEAVFEDELMDDEDRRDWVQDLESVQRMLKAVRPSHTPRSWVLQGFVHSDHGADVELHV